MKKRVNNILQVVKLFFKYKVFLKPNSFICSTKLVFKIILFLRYKKLLKKLHQHNVNQRYLTPIKDLKKSIEMVYFNTPFKNRVYIKDYIIGSFSVAEASSKLKKAQGRNELCNCGSGRKFKKCCLKKY